MCPQATAAATRALRESSMNLNPEVDGTIIKVPVPKWVSLWRTRRQTRRRPENIFAPFSTFCLSLLFFSHSPLFFFWYSSIFLLHSAPCSKLTGLLTFACTCIETPGVTTWGLGQSLSLSPGQIKQPDTKQSVTHSLNRSACVYKVCFFTYTHVHVRLSAWMLSCGYVHALSWVCVCAWSSRCYSGRGGTRESDCFSPCNQSRHAPSLHLHFQREGASWLALESVIRPYCLQ